MITKIYKYKLPAIGGNMVTIDANVVKWLDIKNGFVWAMVDIENVNENKFDIIACGTGWEVNELIDWDYLGTLIDVEGYVWHYFARKRA